MSSNTKMANLKKLMNFFSSQEPTVVALAEEKLENGTVLISDDFKEGTPIFIKSEEEDGENVKLPIGEYQMEDGKILNIEVEGEIASIGEAKIESEESEEEVVEEEVAVEEETEMEEEEEVVAEEIDGDHMQAMHDRIEALEQAIAAMNSEEVVEAKEDEDEYKMSAEEPKEEVKEEVVVEEVAVEVAPIAHSPEVSDEKRVRFYFPKN